MSKDVQLINPRCIIVMRIWRVIEIGVRGHQLSNGKLPH